MIELNGKYGIAKVFTDNIEPGAIEQIIQLLNHESSENANIRIMPDCHEGSGCVIGYTAKLTNKIVPNLIGVDIGCGMLSVNLGNIKIDLKLLDEYIKENIKRRKIWKKLILMISQL
ncbi:MAG: RtcB family protein [Bryobacteraceae bacterium]|jgi:RNA-splicing ligase RtcB